MASPFNDSLLRGIKTLRQEIHEYEPGKTIKYNDDVEDFPKSLHIGLFGRPGCGKSSVLNSIMYAMHGELKRSLWIPTGKPTEGGSFTGLRHAIKISKSIYVVDNKGFCDPEKKATLSEMKYQLDGKRGYTKIVDWNHDIPPEESEQGDPINVVVFVYRAGNNIEGKVADLTKLARELLPLQGFYPVAIITHVDEVKKSQLEKFKEYLDSRGITEVFPVANLIKDQKEHLEPEYQKILLEFLDRCLTDGDRNMIFRREKMREKKREDAGKQPRRSGPCLIQ